MYYGTKNNISLKMSASNPGVWSPRVCHSVYSWLHDVIWNKNSIAVKIGSKPLGLCHFVYRLHWEETNNFQEPLMPGFVVDNITLPMSLKYRFQTIIHHLWGERAGR